MWTFGCFCKPCDPADQLHRLEIGPKLKMAEQYYYSQRKEMAGSDRTSRKWQNSSCLAIFQPFWDPPPVGAHRPFRRLVVGHFQFRADFQSVAGQRGLARKPMKKPSKKVASGKKSSDHPSSHSSRLDHLCQSPRV